MKSRQFLVFVIAVLATVRSVAVVNCYELNLQSVIVDNEYIVTFTEHLSLRDRKRVVTDVLKNHGLEKQFNFITREHKNSGIPVLDKSDYILIKTNNTDIIKTFKSASLDKSNSVSNIVAQRVFSPIMHQEKELNTQKKKVQKRQKMDPKKKLNPAYSLSASNIWGEGIRGQRVRVAVFDTGISRSAMCYFNSIIDNLDWTDEGINNDVVGHGTFVAGVIASNHEKCPGIAPDAEVYSFRIFNKKRMCYTSWFLDAFNYAIYMKIHVLNLSIGGPDFMDHPFVEKVRELSANGITVVSAIGNDGPTYGTASNPADMPDVVGVGGLGDNGEIAPFSSRGMTLWELPYGYGRIKPDLVSYSKNVYGLGIDGKCKVLSGTSVSSPIAAGALALLVSGILVYKNESLVNPAFLKQMLLEGAERIVGSEFSSTGGPGVFEQGAGRLNLQSSFDLIKTAQAHVSAIPPVADFTDCPYMWPYCTQPLYPGSVPAIVNFTLLNSKAVTSTLSAKPLWRAENDLIQVSFTYPKAFWPWSGWLGAKFRVNSESPALKNVSPEKPLIIEGEIVVSLAGKETDEDTILIPVRIPVVQTPPRKKRLLWDIYHNLKYPPGFIPRDIVQRNDQATTQFDLNGDHPHTNMRDLYMALRGAGYYVETLSEPLTCFNASDYGALLLIDTEDEFSQEEIEKVYSDVSEKGLGLVVLADWYDNAIMDRMRFFDENTRLWWTPAIGGSNVPAINKILGKWGIVLGGESYYGKIRIDKNTIDFNTGNTLVRFPANGLVLTAKLSSASRDIKSFEPFMGFYEPQGQSGRIAVLGDSSCADSSFSGAHPPTCLDLVSRTIAVVLGESTIQEEFPTAEEPQLNLVVGSAPPPEGRQEGELSRLSDLTGKRRDVCVSGEEVWINASALPSGKVSFPRVRYVDRTELTIDEEIWKYKASSRREKTVLMYVGLLMTFGGMFFIVILSISSRNVSQKNIKNYA